MLRISVPSARVVLASLFLNLPLWGAPPLAPVELRVNDVVNPVGTGTNVGFGWQVRDDDPGEIQSAYRILVASSAATLAADTGDLWDSGWVADRNQNHVAYAGSAPAADGLCHWKVKTKDKDGNEGPWSAPASFVVGLLSNADWQGAHWIQRSTTATDDYTYYRKQSVLPAKTIERATVYVSSVHKYALYLNGSLVGKGPSYQHPQYQYYNAYDVTALVQSGAANQFAIFNHWFGGGQGRPASSRGVILKAIVRYTDSTTTEIGTDSTWKQSRASAWLLGMPQRNSSEGVGYVENIDARSLPGDWTSASFVDSSWGSALDIGQMPVWPWANPPAPDLTRIRETVIAPASITDKGGGKYVIDLGKVHAGMPRIVFSGGTPGDSITMRGGYELNGAGEIPSGTTSQSTNMEYRAVLDGGTFTYEPVEYLGMRYFQIDNAPMPVTTANFSFVVRHSEMDAAASSFTSSDAMLNAVWDLMKHSLFTCAQEEFVDTPTREKGGFLGDAAIQSTVAMPVLNERALTRRVLGEFQQSMTQHWSSVANRGRMNAVYPNNDGARDIPDYTQAYLPWVWRYYMETGDLSFLQASYAKLTDIANYVYGHRDGSSGLIRYLTGGSGSYQYGIVDWPATMRYGYDMTTAARTVINSWAYADFDTMSKIADELGNTTDRDTWRNRADALATAINAELINGLGVYVDGLSSGGSRSSHVSQHANMFPLALGIVPPAQTASVTTKVKDLQMSVGMVTLPWLVRAIGEADEGEHLIELFTNASWDGWANCLGKGATCTWESWDADTTGQSLSHAWGAAGLEGYVRYILGIKPTLPQYEEVQIKPLDFGAALESAGGTIPTDRGDISVNWVRGADSFTLDLTLPVNVTATVAVPGTAPSVIRLDGVEVPAVEENGYLRISGVGSGAHTIERAVPVSGEAYPFPGNPPITPRWGYEPWVWEDNGNTQASITGLVADYQSRDIPVGAVIVDSPWSPSYMSYAFDTARYPDPQTMIDDFRAQDIQVVCWMAGMVNQTSTDTPVQQHPDFGYVRSQGFQVADPDGDDVFNWWKGDGLAIDFTNPSAVNWFMGNSNASLIAMGVRGFKVDEHNAYLNTASGMLETSTGSVYAGGQITKEQYTQHYYATVADWIRDQTAATDHDGLTIARPYSHQGQPAGFHAPVSKLTAGWCGDFGGDFSGFASQLAEVYISAAAGYSAVGLEIGGYQGAAPTRDSLLRQAQFAALLPIMENGGSNGGLAQHLPWYWDGSGTTATDNYRYFATLHRNLAPFQFHCGVVANLTGVPAVTETDTAAQRHVLGDAFLTRAVTGGDGTTVSVSFPSGFWADWWHPGTLIQGGGSVNVSSPLNQPPLYVRAGSIIPLNVDNDVTGLGDTGSAGKETVLAFPYGETTLTYHRATGDGISYEDVDITITEGAGGLIVVDSPQSRDWVFKLRCFSAPSGVTGADSFNYDGASGMLTVNKTGAAFTVSVADLVGYSSVSPVVTDAVSPAAPTGLTALPGNALVALDWNDNSEPDLAGYNVYRSTTSGTGFVLIAGNVPDSDFLDTTVTNGVPYFYLVTAVDGAPNESGDSDEVSATPDEGGVAPFAISNLWLSSGGPYQWFNLAAGEDIYVDRTYTYGTPPALADGQRTLRTGNDDKLATDNPFLTFEVNRPVMAYVAMDSRLAPPAWMNDFADSGESLPTDYGVTMTLWGKEFPEGVVALGGNEGVDASSMYAVVVVELPVEEIRRIVVVGNNVVVSVVSHADYTYQLQRSDDLSPASWEDVGSAVPGNGIVLDLTDTGGAAGYQERFYRVTIVPTA